MPLFRNSYVVLEIPIPIHIPQMGQAFRIRPVDGDAVADHDQHYRCILDVHRVGPAGGAQAQLYTSWDGTHWLPVAQVDVNGPEPQHSDMQDLAVIGPFIQARTSVSPENPGDPLPNMTATVRIASDGPFSIRPA